MKRLISICGALAVALFVVNAHAAEVTATLDPAEIEVGESAQLTVTVNGSSSATPNVPDVPGLDIEHVGQSTQIQFVNGAMSASAIHTYQLTPEHAGTFTIPAIRAGGSSSRPLTLTVTGAGGNSAPNQRGQPSGNGNPSAPNNAPPQNDDGATGSGAQFGFIRLVLPKKELYVGEIMPVEIDACVRASMQSRPDELPALTSDGFTLNPLNNKPDQRQRVIDGRVYNMWIWHSALTGVQTGDFPLKMEMPFTVLVQDRTPRHQSTGNDLFDQFFNDPFFNDPTAGRMRQKKVTLESEPNALTVRALPKENRPADFSGAIGHFQLQASASPRQVMAGDPITLKLSISGDGNFDRASIEGLPNGNGWKTYPAKGSFEPTDRGGLAGTKTFEQLVIPNDPSLREIPGLRFSYFDPETHRYETKTSSPIAVSVTGAAPNLAAASPATAASPSTSVAPKSASAAPTPAPASDLVPNQVDAGSAVASLRPIFLNPWFIGGQGLPLCALAGGLIFLGRQRRLAADPRLGRKLAANRAIQTQLAAMDDAMRRRNAAEFFLAARAAFQQRLGERWAMRPETITLAEIGTHMNGGSDGIRPIFEMADRVQYSSGVFGDADYQQWKDVVVQQLKALEKSR